MYLQGAYMKKLILVTTILFSVFVLMFTQSVSGYQVTKSSTGITVSDPYKLSYNLRSIVSKDSGYDVALSSLKANDGVISTSLLGLTTGDNSYHIYVYFNEKFTQADLERFGKVNYFSAEYRMADLWLNTTQITALSTEPDVLNIMEVTPAVFMAGSFLTEGYLDNNHAVKSYLNAGNLAGDGLKIGIISDGTDSVATAISTGDVPADVVIVNNRYGGDEGTAMLEIVHDMAPNAKLFFSDYGNSMLGFNASIKALVDAGCDIIVDDIVYFAEPFFEDGVISKFIESYVTPKGILYLSSAGNYADNHFQGNYTSTYNDNSGNYEQDYNPSSAGVQHMPILIPALSKISIVLQWSDPYTASNHDLDLKICSNDAMTSGCFSSLNYQTGEGYTPYEQINVTNNSGTSYTYYVDVFSYESMSNLKIEIYTFGTIPMSYGTRSDSTFGHSTSKDVLSIAAISQQSNGVTRPYSSLGPFTMRDGTVRNKPDFTGVDQVTVSGVNFYSPFNGTSAAAPHIASVAALLWSNNRSLTRVELIELLKTKSVDLMTEGYDYNSGYGFVTLSPDKLAFFITKNSSVSGSVVMDRLVNISVLNTSTATVSSVSYSVTSDFGATRYRYNFTLNGINSGMTNLVFVDMSNTKIYSRSIIVGVPTPVITVASLGYNSLKATWASISSATGYEVSYSTSQNGTYTVLPLTTSVSAWIPSLLTNTTYYVRVRAYRLVGTVKVYSANSAIVSGKPIPSTPVITLASTGYNSLKATWATISGATGYEVSYSTSQVGTYTVLPVVTTTTTSIPNLLTNTAYYVRVRAYRLVGTAKVYSANSAIVSGKPIPSTPVITLASTGYNSLKATWATISGATGYEVSYSTSQAGTFTVLPVVTTTTTSIPNLLTNTTYYVRVRAYRLVGTVKVYSANSAIVSGKPIPAAPTGVSAVSVSATSTKLSWTSVSGVSGYQVFRSFSATGTYTWLANAFTNSYINSGLTTGTNYW